MLAFEHPPSMQRTPQPDADGLAQLLAFAVAGITGGAPGETGEKRA